MKYEKLFYIFFRRKKKNITNTKKTINEKQNKKKINNFNLNLSSSWLVLLKRILLV